MTPSDLCLALGGDYAYHLDFSFNVYIVIISTFWTRDTKAEVGQGQWKTWDSNVASDTWYCTFYICRSAAQIMRLEGQGGGDTSLE